MSNFTDVANLIKAMSGSGENIVAVNRSYLQFMGSLEGGLFLSQVIFFSDKSKRKDGYFYKTYKDWYEHTFISEYNIRKLTKKMNEMGFLETKIIKANGSPTLHYKFDMNAFVSMFMPFLKNLSMESENIENGNLNIQVSLTEITTETTTEIIKPMLDKPSVTELDVELELEFDDFYKMYPKKVERKRALPLYKKARKKYSEEHIINGLLNYIDWIKLNGTENKYIKGPAVYLNGENFNDEYDFSSIKQNKNKSWGEILNDRRANGSDSRRDIHTLPELLG